MFLGTLRGTLLTMIPSRESKNDGRGTVRMAVHTRPWMHALRSELNVCASRRLHLDIAATGEQRSDKDERQQASTADETAPIIL